MVRSLAVQDAINQATWTRASSRRWLDKGASFTDPGERAALEMIRERVRDKPILDLGVGTGRTIPLLSALTSDYRALDYLPVMVEESRRKYPDANVELGDARSLAQYPTSHFGLVNFSFNGIDAVSARDRRLIFRAVHRVLAPDGIFLFSTLNLDGPLYRDRPWKVRVAPTRNPLRYGWRVARRLAGAPLGLANWLRIRHEGERGSGFAVAPLSAHHYGIVAFYTTLTRQLLELQELGFGRDAVVFENVRGTRISATDDTHNVEWFQIVAVRA